MVTMNWHQVLMRTGWIFKTESLVMPAVLDLVGGSAWLRSFLPMLNRLGQSVPPLLAASATRRAPWKKQLLFTSSVAMGVLFLLLAVIWSLADLSVAGWWLPTTILVVYGVFFGTLGINQLVLSALTGKLIPVAVRGRVMQISSCVGSVIACACAWVLLRKWLAAGQENFVAVFVFAGALFIASGVAAIFFREDPDHDVPDRESSLSSWREAWSLLRSDRNLQLLAVIAALFGSMITLFPHYQALGRMRLGLGYDSLVPWIIAQNVGVALFSLPAGWIADRMGNRRVLKCLMFGLCLVPPLALWLSMQGAIGTAWFFVVFALLGLTPVSMRTFSNYTLELVDRRHQAHYLAIVSMGMAGPAVLASMAVGILIDWAGFELAFALVTACQVAGFLLTFRLIEPRRQPSRR